MKHIVRIFALIPLLAVTVAVSQPDTLWTKLYDNDLVDSCRGIYNCPDGGFILGGYSGTNYFDDVFYWLMKIDSVGNILWSNTFGESSYITAYAYDLILLENGNTILAGCASIDEFCDIGLCMVDETGQMLWEKTFGEANAAEIAHDIEYTENGGFIITGKSSSSSEIQILLLKTDSLGNEEWKSLFSSGLGCWGSSVDQTSDGGYIIGGCSIIQQSVLADCIVIKTNSSGVEEWRSQFNCGGDYSTVSYLHETAEGNFIGCINESLIMDTIIFQLDPDGNLLWSSRIEDKFTVGLVATPDGGHLHGGIVGEPWALSSPFSNRGNGTFIMKTDSLGGRIWDAVYTDETIYNIAAGFICTTEDGGYCIASTVQPESGISDTWLLRFGQCTGIREQTTTTPLDLNLTCYPNPFSSSLTAQFDLDESSDVSISIYDLTGHLLESSNLWELNAGESSIALELREDLPAGCYTVVVESMGIRATSRCIKMN